MRRHLAALALLSVLASPVPASAGAIITPVNVVAIPANNDFKEQLSAFGYNFYTSTGASILLETASYIDFYILASESGNDNSFVSGLDIFGEDNINHFDVVNFDTYGGLLKFTKTFAGGVIDSDALGFTSTGAFAQPAKLGEAGFGIFLKDDWLSGSPSVNRFVIGYDDQIQGPADDNHDDLIVLAVVRAIPEPGTWATLLLGFGALGAAMRRKAKAPRFRAAIA